MLHTRLRKVLRDIGARRGRTLLVAASIFIGVFGTVTLFSLGDILVSKLENDLKQNELAMARTFVDVEQDNRISEAQNRQTLETLRGVPGVTVVEGQAAYPLFWRETGDQDFEEGRVFAYSQPFEDIQLEPMTLVEGAWPVQNRQEVAIEQRMAETYDLAVGDELDVQVLSRVDENSADVPTEHWQIAGIVYQPYPYRIALNIAPSERSVFATYEDAQYIADFKGFRSIYARFDDFETAEDMFTTYLGTIALRTPYRPSLPILEDPAQNSFLETVRTVSRVVQLLALIALGVAGFLVYNVINATVVEQRRLIGVMKSLGANRRDSLLMYAGLAFGYGVIGVVPGVLLGIPAGYLGAQSLASRLNTVIDTFSVSAEGVVLGAMIGLAVPVLASIVPVYNGTRVSILEAMTDRGIDATYGRGPLSHLLGRLPMPVTMRQGLANMLLRKGRTAFTILTLAIAGGAAMSVFAVFSSLNDVVDIFRGTFNYHYYLVPSETEDMDALAATIRQEVEGVEQTGVYVTLIVDMEGYETDFNATTGPPALFAIGYEPRDQMYDLELVDGAGWQNDPDREGVVLPRPMANSMNLAIGDTVRLAAGGSDYQAYPVIGIVEYPFDLIWLRWDSLARLASITNEAGDPMPNGLMVVLDEAQPTSAEVDRAITQTREALVQQGITATYTNVPNFIEVNSQQLDAAQGIFYLTAILISAVGAVGLLTTLSMSVFERQREIGVMRSVGAGSSTVAVQFITEGVATGLLAWLIGIPLSYWLSEQLIAALDFGDAFVLNYPPVTIALGLGGMVLLSLLASSWPALTASRQTVSHILRYQ